MPPTTSRDFQKVAERRLYAAELLLKHKVTLDAQYLAVYVVECSLKALILECTPAAHRAQKLKTITSGARWHQPIALLGELRLLGVALPLDLAKRLRRFERCTTDLRYESGLKDYGETIAILKTAKAVLDWVEGQLP